MGYMKYSHRTWIVISGLVWCAVGILLLVKGLFYIVGAATSSQESSSVLNAIVSLTGTVEQAALFLISLALLVGFIKGRYVLVKTVRRITKRILTMDAPIHVKDVYPKGYYMLLFSMMLMGMLFKWLPIGFALKGFIDVTIGSALINGALLYFKEALAYRMSE
jgi:hypothetical protein